MTSKNPHPTTKSIQIETRTPSKLLQPYIDFYYFINNDSEDFKSVHYSFPHVINVVSIYQQAQFQSSVGYVKISSNPQNKFLSLLQAKCQVPLRVELAGKTNRISIWFKNFGLNHFIRTPLGKVMGNTTNQVLEWDEEPVYHQHLNKCFSTTDFEQRVTFLEQFLLLKLQPIPVTYLEKAVGMLMDIDQNHSVGDVVNQLNVPIRTFNRRFKEVLGVSPIEFQRIARFRHSLNDKLFGKEVKKLTTIGYDNHFYDQSDFIKMYKKLTGSNPKTFFNTVERLGNDNLIFQFIKK